MAGGGLRAWAGGRVLGARHSRLGVVVVRVFHLWSWLLSLGLGCCLWAPRRRSWVVGLVRGWCTSFMGGEARARAVYVVRG